MKEHKELTQYLMKKVMKKRNTQALFFNEIDSVVRQEEEKFLIYGELLRKDYDQDDSVRYSFNSLGFRSDEFTDYHDGEHVLFAGCSETEGQGGNLESLWAYMVYKKLSETKKISGFFNLSRGGWGHDLIIANIIQYIKRYGKPDKIYMLLPNMSRDFDWQGLENKEEYYIYSIKTTFFSVKPFILPDGTVRQKQKLKEQRDLVTKFINLIKLFEEYCVSNNIELVWSTYSIPDGRNYKNLNVFNNFIDMSDADEIISKSKNLFKEELYNKKNIINKRDGHQGYLFHYHWAQKFLGLSTEEKL
jgi:hypothetical protein